MPRQLPEKLQEFQKIVSHLATLYGHSPRLFKLAKIVRDEVIKNYPNASIQDITNKIIEHINNNISKYRSEYDNLTQRHNNDNKEFQKNVGHINNIPKYEDHTQYYDNDIQFINYVSHKLNLHSSIVNKLVEIIKNHIIDTNENISSRDVTKLSMKYFYDNKNVIQKLFTMIAIT